MRDARNQSALALLPLSTQGRLFRFSEQNPGEMCETAATPAGGNSETPIASRAVARSPVIHSITGGSIHLADGGHFYTCAQMGRICSMHEAERLWQRSLDGNLEQVRGLGVDRDGAVRLEECRDLILNTAAHSAERRVRVHWKKEERMRVRRHAWVLCESEVVAVI